MTEGIDNNTQEVTAAGAKAAVVTGASTGIGEATVRALRKEGWTVFAVARRADRLEALAAETGAVALPADVTDDADGARGADKVAGAKTEDWEWMFQVNVLGSMKLIRAFLPMLRACGEGTVLNLTSTAGLSAYEGGGGYNAAKFAQHALTGALRLEEAEHNLRVIEVAPGMVQTEEFSLNRLGDQGAAEKVYAGVAKPLTADDVADVVRYAVTAPHHVNLDQIVIRPVAQASNFKVIRKG